MDSIREALLYCFLMNYGLLLIWIIMILLPHQWMYTLLSKCFRISPEMADKVNYVGITAYKLGILIFNLVPYLALVIVSHRP